MQKAFDLIKERLEKGVEHCLTMHDWQGQSVYESAIEIVNQVAEEYKSTEHINCSSDSSIGEVCEYVKMKNTGNFMMQKSHNACEHSFRVYTWKYCPYCGKKIKVVKNEYN